jgi:signal transduction histidine kinase
MLTDVAPQRLPQSLMVSADFPSFRRQETVLACLNLILQISLFLAQLYWPQYLGRPHLPTLAVLGTGVATNLIELFWLGRREELSAAAATRLTWTMIVVNIAVAFGLASFSYKQDVQYFTLMLPPILQAAFRLSLAATILTVAISDSLIFFWVWSYARAHAPADPNEFIEAGTVALIYAVTGLLVWTLVNHLRHKQAELAFSLSELERTQSRLKAEERLAAVGRFSSAIAHEIRNPVAMISSALATASNYGFGAAESQEMYAIATKEAGRLERLTTDFLVYARPRVPAKMRSDLGESIGYIAEICRPRAGGKDVDVVCEYPEGLWAEVDSGQLQQALLNLAMNAIEASNPGARVQLRGRRAGNQVLIDVDNGNGPIAPSVAACVFEPFFTTRPSGTGLGLAIARNIVIAHGGELALTHNDAETIRFTVSLPIGINDEGGAP